MIINSPNNPTGVIVPRADLIRLAALLSEKEKAYEHKLYLIADEPYRKLVWNGETVPFVPQYYADTLVCYSFSKAASLPGERIGYILVAPGMQGARMFMPHSAAREGRWGLSARRACCSLQSAHAWMKQRISVFTGKTGRCCCGS